MNLINIRAISGGADAPCSASFEDDAEDARSFEQERSDPRDFRRRHLHWLYRDTLKDYRNPTTDWMRRATRNTLKAIWENYRNA